MTGSATNRRISHFESLETKKLMTADMGLEPVGASDATLELQAAIVDESQTFGVEREMKESGEKGGTEDINIGVGELQECTISKSMDTAASSREMKESGEKGETEDINIGVGELQECTISKSMDTASASLAQFAINGNSLGTAEIDFVEVAGSSDLDGDTVDAVMRTLGTSSDSDDRPTEEVAFYYNKG
ncbi:MAG: type VI secretion system tube protein Hcp [Planctomycetales bacterium]|nr:type VI secretion system tube protein Hcp [Planctomycetales bacterium]